MSADLAKAAAAPVPPRDGGAQLPHISVLGMRCHEGEALEVYGEHSGRYLYCHAFLRADGLRAARALPLISVVEPFDGGEGSERALD